jgi:hypothetical protein
MYDPLLFIIYGLIIRFLAMTITLRLGIPLPSLPAILGVAAIAYYAYYSDTYDDYYYVNIYTMIGLFLPECFKFAFKNNSNKKKRKTR